MSFATSSTFASTSATAVFSSVFLDVNPLNMNEPTSLVPATHLNKKVFEMVNTQVNCGVIDYFIDVLAAVGARVVIASRYKAAFELKTFLLTRRVTEYISRGLLDARTILTAIVYLSDIRLDTYDTGDFVCERLAIGALMLAHKTIKEPSYRGDQWLQLARIAFGQHLTRRDLNHIEREFLSCLRWKMNPTNTALLAHYDVFMNYARRDLQTYLATTIHPRSVVAEPHCTTSAPTTTAASDIPDLMYPDSPSLSDSDGYSSDSDTSSEVITPPSSGNYAYASSGTHTGRVGPARKPRSSPYPYPRPSRRTPSSSHSTDSPVYERNDYRHTSSSAGTVDAVIEDKVRYYAADHGTVLRESGSPRYVPYSPSQRYTRRDRYDLGPTPPPMPALKHWSRQLVTQSTTITNYRRGEEQPWRRYQNWKSTMPGKAGLNDPWGTFGLFRQ